MSLMFRHLRATALHQPSVHQQHILSLATVLCRRALTDIWTWDFTARLKCCSSPQTLIERCGAAPPCYTQYVFLPLLLDHNSHLQRHTQLSEWILVLTMELNMLMTMCITGLQYTHMQHDMWLSKKPLIVVSFFSCLSISSPLQSELKGLYCWG